MNKRFSHYEATAEVIQIRIGAFLNNNVASAHCINISERSTQGVETPCYKSWIATLSLAMTEKILSLRGFEKSEAKARRWRVIHKKEILLFWIATLSLAMTEKIKSLTLCATLR